jgi:Leucine-rich repeat (LRR) protein
MVLLYIMSEIEDVTDAIEQYENDAQTYFEGLLNTLDPNETYELRLEIPLSGSLDFSLLKDKQFNRVDNIVFQQPGQVTELRNIPEGVVYIECANQSITEFDNGPASLEELYMPDNKMHKFSGKQYPKLRILNVSDNQLTHLDNLPATLKTLECSNNQIRKISLEKTQELVTLKASNNPLLILSHVPPSLVDMEMENNPFTEIEREDGTKKDKKKQEKKMEFMDGLREYFRLKDGYEKKLLKMKKNAFEKGGNKKEGRKFASTVKPACIHCKKKVGTLFYFQDDTYYAICGDKTKPCDLYIKIYRGSYFPLDEMMEIGEEEIEKKKEEIIRLKMDTLFKYVTSESTSRQFKKDLEEYNEESRLHKKTLEQYDRLYDNVERISQTSKKQEKVYEIMQDIKSILNEYHEKGSRELLNAAVDMQIKDLIPALKNLRWMKYDTMFMEDSNETGVSSLVQREVSVHHKDYLVGREPSVLKFVVK